jgi:hypothetical protein
MMALQPYFFADSMKIGKLLDIHCQIAYAGRRYKICLFSGLIWCLKKAAGPLKKPRRCMLGLL